MKEKEIYVRKAQLMLEEISVEINILSRELRDREDDAGEMLREELYKIKSRKESTKAKLMQVKNGPEAGWQGRKGLAERAINDLKSGLRRIRVRIYSQSGKLSPG